MQNADIPVMPIDIASGRFVENHLITASFELISPKL